MSGGEGYGIAKRQDGQLWSDDVYASLSDAVHRLLACGLAPEFGVYELSEVAR